MLHFHHANIVLTLPLFPTANNPDIASYADRPSSAVLPQLITLPLGFILTSLVGIIIASCSQSIYGKVVWDPVQHLGMILDDSPSHAARFGVFFIALCFIYVQLILVSETGGYWRILTIDLSPPPLANRIYLPTLSALDVI